MKTKELFSTEVPYLKEVFDKSTYPWEILPQIKEIVAKVIASGLEGYKEIEPGILVAENVKIAKTATIEAPAIIGKDTELRPGAYLRGNVIVGEKCVVGNSSELKNCILLNHVQVPHYNYVGDSILGDYAHMGAGSILSNLKSGGKNIVIHGDKEYETGLRKIGGFLGEHADIGCGSVLNPGTIIGKNTQVYPLSMLRGCFPENSIVKSQTVVVDKIEQ
ncbi:MAG: UDP-N-acetylglucosamine pyrophosphorylase [Bacilli bacterium]|nr:UDP-N-acetylglucosamine pyrophosphorylase [Bacilli bacterium]